MLGLLTSALVFLVPMRVGTRLFTRLKFFEDRPTTFLTGGIFGLVAYTLLSLAFHFVFGMELVTILGPLVLFAATELAPQKMLPGKKKSFRTLPIDPAMKRAALLVGILFLPLAWKVLILDETGYVSGYRNVLGDIPWHAELINAFADGQTTPPTNPSLSGATLGYPFLVDYFSSLLVKLGWNLGEVFRLPVFLFVPWTLLLLFACTKRLTDSNRAAAFALALFLFAGSTLGFLELFAAFRESTSGFFSFFSKLPDADVTAGMHKPGHAFYSPYLCALVPQRSLLFATPLALTLVLLLSSKVLDRSRLIIAGITAGMIPMAHAHTVLALVPVVLGFLIVRRSRDWWRFFAAAAAIGIPQVFYLLFVAENHTPIKFHFGWMKEQENFFLFWFRNTGFLVPLSFFALKRKVPPMLRVLTIASLVIWAVANLFQFAPWIWDNYKLFYYWLLFSVPAIGYTLSVIWAKGKKTGRIATVVLLLGFQCLSGALDLWKTAMPNSTDYGIWPISVVRFAEQARALVPPESTIAHYPTFNSAVPLMGRFSYLGFPGHIWSHGINAGPRENALREYFQGHRIDLPFSPGRVSHLIVGPQERGGYKRVILPNESLELLLTEGEYSLYRITAQAPVP